MADIYAMKTEDGIDREMTGWRSSWPVRWARAKIFKPLMVILRRGTEPKQLAFTAALGFTLGVFAIYGVTALLCGLAVATLGTKCNGPTLILANLLATPIEWEKLW